MWVVVIVADPPGCNSNVPNSVKLCELFKKESNLNILQGLPTFFVIKLVGEGPRGPVS